jgi:hypothetical protein
MQLCLPDSSTGVSGGDDPSNPAQVAPRNRDSYFDSADSLPLMFAIIMLPSLTINFNYFFIKLIDRYEKVILIYLTYA